MSFEKLFSIIKEKFLQADVSRVKSHVACEFQVQGEARGTFYVEIKDGEISVEPYDYYDKQALFTATDKTYLEICQGELNPMIAFAVGRVKVTGELSKAQIIGTLFE